LLLEGETWYMHDACFGPGRHTCLGRVLLKCSELINELIDFIEA